MFATIINSGCPNFFENEMILMECACDYCTSKELHLLVNDDEEAIEDIEKLLLVILLFGALKEVELMLEGSVEVSIPPVPFSFSCSV